jgi:hypothetical protein
MTIYEELIKRVEEGESFYINFKNQALKIGKDFLVADGFYDDGRTLYTTSELDMSDVLSYIEMLYENYKHSLPSERSDSKRRQYFKALPVDKLTDKQMATGERRAVARAKLEGFILCMIVDGFFVWDEKEMGKFAVAFRCCNEDTLRLVMSQLTSKGKLWPILKTAAERVKAKNRKAAKLLETEGYSYSTHSNSHTAYFYMS